MVRADRLSGRARRKAAFRGGIRVTGFLPVSIRACWTGFPKQRTAKCLARN